MNHGDFIISWNATETHFTLKDKELTNQLTIPRGSINFSKLERDNEDLHQVMIYERAILSLVVFLAFFRNLWNTLLITLGISPAIYERANEEKLTMERQEKTWRDKLEKQRYNEWLRSHK